MQASFLNYSIIRPLSYFGLTSSIWDVHLDTLIETWIMMSVLLLASLYVLYALRSPRAVLSRQAILLTTGFFVDLIEETCGVFHRDIFYFSTTIFLFVGAAGFTGLIPYAGEATQDLNTTFALGISSFCFSQYQGIKAHGLYHFNEYLKPFFPLLPLNIVGECAKAASMSFRLFGNILGGSIMVDLILKALGACKEFYISTAVFLVFVSVILYSTPLLRYFKLRFFISFHSFIFYAVILVPTIQLFFGVIESLVQAFVLTTLTITYSSMAIGDEEDLIKTEGA
ncbi:hypothetical protein COB28_01725 [Candidatus Dependentiae bacterium]|nr:MAG: hypothetical protein COB28_01725 [Candidatus Dependentiae bacterium]